MREKLLLVLFCVGILTGCNSLKTYHSICPNDSCQKDYWGDYQTDHFFQRQNCVGKTGAWVDIDGGKDGYYCTTPKCETPSRVVCTDVCPHF